MAHLLSHEHPENCHELFLDNQKIPSIHALLSSNQDTNNSRNSLRAYTNLRHLSLNNCALQSLDGFPNFPRLAKLDLGDNRIQGGLEPLATLQTLVSLDLSNNRISDPSVLLPLAQLPSLRILNLVECDVSKSTGGSDDYPNNIFAILPSLQAVDDRDRNGNEVEMYSEDEDEEDDEEDEGYQDASGSDEEPEEDNGTTRTLSFAVPPRITNQDDDDDDDPFGDDDDDNDEDDGTAGLPGADASNDTLSGSEVEEEEEELDEELMHVDDDDEDQGEDDAQDVHLDRSVALGVGGSEEDDLVDEEEPESDDDDFDRTEGRSLVGDKGLPSSSIPTGGDQDDDDDNQEDEYDDDDEEEQEQTEMGYVEDDGGQGNHILAADPNDWALSADFGTGDGGLDANGDGGLGGSELAFGLDDGTDLDAFEASRKRAFQDVDAQDEMTDFLNDEQEEDHFKKQRTA
ncbi:hypothetical protein HKX48_001647 [Thoreauomyces humboldtii]|nr:hypothetical protein HKX48_001647 [Thoreauomyces humboldtii]